MIIPVLSVILLNEFPFERKVPDATKLSVVFFILIRARKKFCSLSHRLMWYFLILMVIVQFSVPFVIKIFVDYAVNHVLIQLNHMHMFVMIVRDDCLYNSKKGDYFLPQDAIEIGHNQKKIADLLQ
jgi:hypothetical protein